MMARGAATASLIRHTRTGLPGKKRVEGGREREKIESSRVRQEGKKKGRKEERGDYDFYESHLCILSIVNPLSGTFSEAGGKLLEELVSSHSKGCKMYAYCKDVHILVPGGKCC